MSTALNATIIPFPTIQAGADRTPAGGAGAGSTHTKTTRAARAARTQAVVKTRMRLTRRGRVVVTTLAAIPLVIAAAVFAVNGGGAVASSESGHVASFSHVTVSSGQSLWQIAERVAPSYDPRDVVASIVDLNQLPSAMVMPGQRLAIPAEYSK